MVKSKEVIVSKEKGGSTDNVDVSAQPAKQKRASYGTPRKLITWDPDVDQLLLLAIFYECDKADMEFCLEKAILHVCDSSSAEAARQHIAKVRIAREVNGRPVPPPSRVRKEDPKAPKAEVQDIEDMPPPLAKLLHTAVVRKPTTATPSRSVKRSRPSSEHVYSTVSAKKTRTQRKGRASKIKIEDEEAIDGADDAGPDPDLANDEDEWTPSNDTRAGKKSKGKANVKSVDKKYEFDFEESTPRIRRGGINYKEPDLDEDLDEDIGAYESADTEIDYVGKPGETPYGGNEEDEEDEEYDEVVKDTSVYQKDNVDEHDTIIVASKRLDPFSTPKVERSAEPTFTARFPDFSNGSKSTRNKAGLGINTGLNNLHFDSHQSSLLVSPTRGSGNSVWGAGNPWSSSRTTYGLGSGSFTISPYSAHTTGPLTNSSVGRSISGSTPSLRAQAIDQLVSQGIDPATANELFTNNPERYAPKTDMNMPPTPYDFAHGDTVANTPTTSSFIGQDSIVSNTADQTLGGLGQHYMGQEDTLVNGSDASFGGYGGNYAHMSRGGDTTIANTPNQSFAGYGRDMSPQHYYTMPGGFPSSASGMDSTSTAGFGHHLDGLSEDPSLLEQMEVDQNELSLQHTYSSTNLERTMSPEQVKREIDDMEVPESEDTVVVGDIDDMEISEIGAMVDREGVKIEEKDTDDFMALVTNVGRS